MINRKKTLPCIWNFFSNLTAYFQLFTTSWLISAPNINHLTFGIILDRIIWTPAILPFMALVVIEEEDGLQ